MRVFLARLVASLLVLLAASAPVVADDFAALVGGLVGDSFAEKEKAVQKQLGQKPPRPPKSETEEDW